VKVRRTSLVSMFILVDKCVILCVEEYLGTGSYRFTPGLHF
jgi:hypothetical protein